MRQLYKYLHEKRSKIFVSYVHYKRFKCISQECMYAYVCMHTHTHTSSMFSDVSIKDGALTLLPTLRQKGVLYSQNERNDEGQRGTALWDPSDLRRPPELTRQDEISEASVCFALHNLCYALAPPPSWQWAGALIALVREWHFKKLIMKRQLLSFGVQ